MQRVPSDNINSVDRRLTFTPDFSRRGSSSSSLEFARRSQLPLTIMDLGSKIFISGHAGLVGSAIRRRLETLGYKQLLLRTPDELDLTRQEVVEELFAWERPDYVFLADGNRRNSVARSLSYGDSLYQSLATEFNVISIAQQAGTKRLLFLGASCIYPQWVHQDIAEACARFGQMNETDRRQAVAKLAGVELCDAYNRQRGCRFLAVIPSNPNGRGHTYDLHHSNLIPSMMAKLHQAKLAGQPTAVFAGPGNLRRGFLYTDELANACVSLMNLNDGDFAALLSSPSGPLVNVDCEEDLTARELAELIADVVMFKGEVCFEASDSDNPPEYCPNSRMQTLNWPSTTRLKERLYQAYRDFSSQGEKTEWESSPSPFLQENNYAGYSRA